MKEQDEQNLTVNRVKFERDVLLQRINRAKQFIIGDDDINDLDTCDKAIVQILDGLIDSDEFESKTTCYTCFNCLHNTVVWEQDLNYEDCWYEGDGIVHLLHCTNCQAEIEYKVPLSDHNNEDDKTNKNTV